MMETMKLLGNIIICDDTAGQVGIIDSETMEKIKQIKLPFENFFLKSSYKDERTKTLLLAFDNR